MFTKLMEQREAKESGDSLWEQCFVELVRVGQGEVKLEEVDRLASLVSKQIHGDFQEAIQEVVADPTNGFADLPF
jgi:hypothetical protein